jgi:hypothetical protein
MRSWQNWIKKAMKSDLKMPEKSTPRGWQKFTLVYLTWKQQVGPLVLLHCLLVSVPFYFIFEITPGYQLLCSKASVSMKPISNDLQDPSVVVGGKRRHQIVTDYLHFGVGCV